MKNRKVCLKMAGVAMILLLPFSAIGQESKLGNWYIYIGNWKLNEKWNIHNEIQYRNYNAFGDLEQLLLRTGIGHNLTENNNNILLGYGFIHSQSYSEATDEKENTNEHRVFQQFITKQNINRIALQHRYRFEQRFIKADFKLRFRYFLGLTIPVNHEEMTDKTFYLSAYNEIFLNAKNNIFDRNRLYAGLGYKINSKVRLELGYMNQFLNTTNRDQINIIAFINY